MSCGFVSLRCMFVVDGLFVSLLVITCEMFVCVRKLCLDFAYVAHFNCVCL